MASAQAALDEAERQDVASAAQRAREGQALGTPPVSVRKAREALDLRKRDHAALVLAQSGAEVDLAAALAVTADDWASALDTEIAQARERARAALDQFEQAMSEISTSATAALWLASGRSDARWDRRPALAFTGTVALSSRARTINGEPMPVSELVAYLHEALEPPTSTQTSIEPTTSRA
jgi:hypothetical protein